MLEATLKFQKSFDLLEVIDRKYVNRLTPKSQILKDESSDKNDEANADVWPSEVKVVEFMNSLYFDMDDNMDSTKNKTELDINLLEISEDRNDKSFDILVWWKANAARYPILLSMA
ncbi:HAT, C-terminal dimerization domain [Dillenia turbinata]|uniref:HAT, C-terminal dimerization domain n=1 Tax=Dillenia turbinata TaxID=194707 RepID=A0AAN8UUM5_9MAGN